MQWIVVIMCLWITTTKSETWRTLLVAANIPIVGVVLYMNNSNRFDSDLWIKQRFTFTIGNGNGYSQIDKLGNAYYSYVFTKEFTRAYEWAGFNRLTASLLASTNILLLQTWQKYHEAFYTPSKHHVWGWDILDSFAALYGTTLAVIQMNNRGTFLDRLKYKWGFVPNHTGFSVGGSYTRSPLNNYSIQIFVLTYRVGDYFFDSKWLQPIAIGITAQLKNDLSAWLYKVTLDYHLSKLIPGFIGEMLDYFYFSIFPTLWVDEAGRFRVGIALNR